MQIKLYFRMLKISSDLFIAVSFVNNVQGKTYKGRTSEGDTRLS